MSCSFCLTRACSDAKAITASSVGGFVVMTLGSGAGKESGVVVELSELAKYWYRWSFKRRKLYGTEQWMLGLATIAITAW